MKKMDGTSLDIVAENVGKLKELFPEAFTEGSIDFEALKEVLGEYIDDREERYSFNWNGKSKARLMAQTPSTGTLRPCPEESVDWESTQNVFIEGDNLEVLKLLQKSYHKKVKMIYIDPPYNTGKDFVYKDNFKDNIKNYKEITGQIDGEGRNLSSNPETSGRYHTDWLNMIYPRLKLARNLLKDDGVIFISIDDNEVTNLRKICDEIFGVENFVNCISIKLSEATGVKMAHVKKRFPKLKEYILLYKKQEILINPPSIPKGKWDKEYKHLLLGVSKEELDTIKAVMEDDEASNEDIMKIDEICSKISLTSIQSLFNENSNISNTEKNTILEANAWRIVRDVATTGGAKKIADKKKLTTSAPFFVIVTPKNKKYLIKSNYSSSTEQPRIKLLFADSYLTVNPGDFWEDIKTTGLDNEGFVDFRNGKKPIKAIERLINSIVCKNDIVLDFFAGSGTTANSLFINNLDNGKQNKFILVQLPEAIDSKDKGQKDSYNFCIENGIKPVISEISKERIRRAAAEIKEENPDYNGDLGFKAFRLDSSNIKPWDADFETLDGDFLDSMIENIKPDRSEADVLYEILLKYGHLLTLPITEHTIAGQTVYDIGLGALIVCLSKNITLETVEGIAVLKEELKPEVMRVVFKDTGFNGDDNIKTNAVNILKQAGIEDVKSI